MMRTLLLIVVLLLQTHPALANKSAGGHLLLETWQLEDARLVAEKLLVAEPESVEALLLASRVQYFRGKHLSSLGLLELALEKAQGGASALYTRVRDTARYAPYFETLESEHFEIRYIDKDIVTATYAREVLEAAYLNIGGALEFLPAERGEKIVVEIYPDALGLAAATGLTVGEIETSGTIAVAKYHRLMITSPLGTANGYGWADTLAHEFTHLVISKKSNNTIPIWFHEGIAKYYETLWYTEAGKALQPFSEQLLAEATKTGEFITFEQMHPSMAKLPSQKATGLAFAEVFTVVEYLREKFGNKSIPKILELAGQGMAFEQALQKVFGAGLKTLEQRWQAWVRKRKFNLVPGARPQVIALQDAQNQNAEQEDPLEALENPAAQRFSRLGELLQMRGHHQAAAIEYEKARVEVGDSYPTLSYRLAKAYAKLGQNEKAIGILTSSLRLHPDNTDGRLLAGRLELRRKRYRPAKEHFEMVKWRNPYNPELHSAMAEIHTHFNEAAKAEEARRFLAICQKPRVRHHYDLPPAFDLKSGVVLIPERFGLVRIMGHGMREAPAAGVLLPPGAHAAEFSLASGKLKTIDFQVLKGGDTLLLQ